MNDRQPSADRLRAYRAEIERRLLDAAPKPPGDATADGAGDEAAAVAAALVDALIADAAGGGAGGGRLGSAARRHGILRARVDGLVDALLAEYAALRLGLLAALAEAGGGAWDADAVALHGAIDAAAGAAAAAFNHERLRQNRAVLRGQDHDIRGCLNAIRLAAYVHRQTGTDTADVIERQTARLRDALDHSRRTGARAAAAVPGSEALPTDDLVGACRQQVAAWNTAHAAEPCLATLAGSCIDRFDTERVRETLDTLLEAAAHRAGPGAALELRLNCDVRAAEIAILALPASSAAGRRPSTARERHGARPLAAAAARPDEPIEGAPGKSLDDFLAERPDDPLDERPDDFLEARPDDLADDPPDAPPDWPLRWLLARQTAAACGGTLDALHGTRGARFELKLLLTTTQEAVRRQAAGDPA